MDTLLVSIEAEGAKPVSFTVDVNLKLLPEAKGVDEKFLADDAVKAAFEAIEKELKQLK